MSSLVSFEPKNSSPLADTYAAPRTTQKTRTRPPNRLRCTFIAPSSIAEYSTSGGTRRRNDRHLLKQRAGGPDPSHAPDQKSKLTLSFQTRGFSTFRGWRYAA